MRKLVIALMAFFVVLGAALAQEHPSEHPKTKPDKATAGAGALDGKVCVGELVKAGEKAGDKDQLTFKGGKFVSAACVPFGFHEAKYTATEKDGVITFASKPTNADGETMSWTGTIKGGVVEATAIYNSKSGETTYTYKGNVGSAKADEHPKSEHPSEHPKN